MIVRKLIQYNTTDFIGINNSSHLKKKSIYSKCSKIFNTFLFLFSNKMLVSQIAFLNSKQRGPRSGCLFISSLIVSALFIKH